GRTPSASATPTPSSFSSARSSGTSAAMNRRGLSGQPWYTPTSCRTGSVAPSTATYHSMSWWTDPNAFRRSYQTWYSLRCMRRVWSRSVVATKLCSWQPLYARKPFCAIGSSAFPSR
ncbi:hypothetical protein PHMEG_00024015, partial [Phytophthora megakarya]